MEARQYIQGVNYQTYKDPHNNNNKCLFSYEKYEKLDMQLNIFQLWGIGCVKHHSNKLSPLDLVFGFHTSIVQVQQRLQRFNIEVGILFLGEFYISIQSVHNWQWQIFAPRPISQIQNFTELKHQCIWGPVPSWSFSAQFQFKKLQL